MQLEKTYTLAMKVRATAVTEINVMFAFEERGRGKGDTLLQDWPHTDVRLKPSSGWQTIHKGFKMTSKYGNDRVETGNPDVTMRLRIIGRPNLVCDIASIAVTAGGTLTPDEPAPTTPAAPQTTPAKQDDKKSDKKSDKKNDKKNNK